MENSEDSQFRWKMTTLCSSAIISWPKWKIKIPSRPFCTSGRYISISVISFFLPLVKRRLESFKITVFSAIFSIHLKLTAKIRKKSKICLGQVLGNSFVVSTSYRMTSWLLGRAQTNIKNAIFVVAGGQPAPCVSRIISVVDFFFTEFFQRTTSYSLGALCASSSWILVAVTF